MHSNLFIKYRHQCQYTAGLQLLVNVHNKFYIDVSRNTLQFLSLAYFLDFVLLLDELTWTRQ